MLPLRGVILPESYLSWFSSQDRPWNDPGPRRGKAVDDRLHLPTLKAIILDFSSVNNVDITSVQHLIDVRNQLDRYASPEKVDWHFACITNRWTKRALSSAGFGYPTPPSDPTRAERWKPIFSLTDIGGSTSAAAVAQRRDNEIARKRQQRDIEGGKPSFYAKGNGADDGDITNDTSSVSSGHLGKEFEGSPAYTKQRGGASKAAVVEGLNRPLFHIDLTIALQSAITNVEAREVSEAKGGAYI